MKTIKKDRESKQKINTEVYLQMTKSKRENMEKTDTIICLKKKIEAKRISKKLSRGKKVSI